MSKASFSLQKFRFIVHPSSFILPPSSFILHPSSFILPPSSLSERRLTAFPGTDPDHVVHRSDKYLAVAKLSRLR